MTNCNQGGCHRCANPDLYPPGEGYDVCICVHAEGNALLTAARFGISAKGADIYSTVAPCFTCMKELLQANVRNVYYLGEFRNYGNDLDLQIKRLVRKFRERGKCQRLTGEKTFPIPDEPSTWPLRQSRIAAYLCREPQPTSGTSRLARTSDERMESFGPSWSMPTFPRRRR